MTTNNERAICAINEAARAAGLNYGVFVATATEEELRRAIRDWKPPKEKQNSGAASEF